VLDHFDINQRAYLAVKWVSRRKLTKSLAQGILAKVGGVLAAKAFE